MNIYQTNVFDFCADFEINNCVEYNVTKASALRYMQSSLSTRFWILYNVLSKPSLFLTILEKKYNIIRQDFHLLIPDMSEWNHAMGPIESLATWDHFLDNIKQLNRGEFYFFHALIPHFPYYYDKECRPKKHGYLMYGSVSAAPLRNTQETRRVRYQNYFEQLLCVNSYIAATIEAVGNTTLGKEAVIIIHGDHGSRISIADPGSPNEGINKIEKQDLRDLFSTLFAYRIPNQLSENSSAPIPLEESLGKVLRQQFNTMHTEGKYNDQVFLSPDQEPHFDMQEAW